jgi:hypothetical protein
MERNQQDADEISAILSSESRQEPPPVTSEGITTAIDFAESTSVPETRTHFDTRHLPTFTESGQTLLRLPTPPSAHIAPNSGTLQYFHVTDSNQLVADVENNHSPHSSLASRLEYAKQRFHKLIISPRYPWRRDSCDSPARDSRDRVLPTRGRPYITLGMQNPQGQVTNEITMKTTKSECLFACMRKGIRMLRPLHVRIFSLKKVVGFGVYRSTTIGPTDFSNTVVPDARTAVALTKFWREYKSQRPDFDDRWSRWVQEGLNAGGTEPEDGMYGLSLKMGWSAKKFVNYGVFGILASLIAGFGITFGWTKEGMQYSDEVALCQTAWTVASYIVTTAGGKLTSLFFVRGFVS